MIKKEISYTLLMALIVVSISCSNTKIVNSSDLAHITNLSKLNKIKGKKIYRGNVFPDYSNEQQYFYERWLIENENSTVANHATYTMDKKKLVIQSAKEDKSNNLIHYDEIHIQKGYIGSILIEHKKVKIIRRYKGKDEINVETLGNPVVVGPTLFGYIQNNWDSLIAGKENDISFGLIERLETFDFTIKFKSKNSKEVNFILTPTSFLMKLFVSDLEVDFDPVTKKVLRYKGAVPQYHMVDGDFKKVYATSIYEYIK